MSESRIVLTDRLRSEGRWDESSRFRDEQRHRLRDEGWSRREANQESWRLMEEKFPPPDEEARASFAALAEFPSEHVPDELQPEFSAVWSVVCRLMSFACYCQPGLAEADDLLLHSEARLRASEPGSDPVRDLQLTDEVLQSAFEDDPLAFLDRAAEKFREARGAVTGMSVADKTTRAELAAFEAAIPALRQALIDHWPCPLEEAVAGTEEDKPPALLTETKARAYSNPYAR